MRNDGKFNVLGVAVSSVDYEGVTQAIVDAARDKRPLKVTAQAVHGIVTAALDKHHRYRLNRFDIIAPDGQPVRWALNLLHGRGLKKRVYGPDLMLEVCRRAAEEGLSVYLYGSLPEVLDLLEANLMRRFPKLKIAGIRKGLFRLGTEEEKADIVADIRASKADIVLVGLGCPRQEIFLHEYADLLDRPMLAVGAAFHFHAGLLPQAPGWMQDRGLEWLFRLIKEPTRLWKRYLLLNPRFLTLLALQWTGLSRFADQGEQPPHEVGHA